MKLTPAASRSHGDIGARVEAPVTMKAYMLCAFAAFGGSYTTSPCSHSANIFRVVSPTTTVTNSESRYPLRL